MITLRISRDAAALSVGADAVAGALVTQLRARGLEHRLVRTGSRGLCWLEPLVEAEVDGAWRGFGPVTTTDVPALVAAGFPVRGHPLALGPVDDLPVLRSQQRLTFARTGLVDPRSVPDYVAHGGYAGLRRALGLPPADIVREVTESGLRGRGGAAFPTGVKWQTVLDQPTGPKFVACNADEGDSGTFADRLLMEGDPFALVEGMTIAGLAVGASEGYVYLRVEYPHAARALAAALTAARDAGWLGRDIQGSGRHFDIEIRLGAGAYICGEETSMLESLEGRRGEVRVRPPMPAVRGLYGRPTVVNNVVTLATVPVILARGAAFYRDFGTGRSRGTAAIQLAGNVRRGGLVERAFGLTLRELVEDYGGGTASGRPVRAVQIGGPLGAWLPPSAFDTVVDYEALASVGAPLGHGGIVVFDDTVNLARMARFAMAFCAHESCGKCAPCRLGSTRGTELLDRVCRGEQVTANLALLEEVCETMAEGSLCGLGGMAPIPVRSAIRHFPEDFRARR